MKCGWCNDTIWVCEEHPHIAWDSGTGCCGAAGQLCECHPNSQDTDPHENGQFDDGLIKPKELN